MATRWLKPVCVAAGLFLTTLGVADADGIGERARDAVDPDCSLGKAAKGAARKATIGVRGNRCDAAETTRDALGIDDRDRRERDRDDAERRLRKD